MKPDARGFGPDAEKSVLGSVSSVAKKAAAIIGGAFAVQRGFDFLKGTVAEARESNKVAAQTEAAIKSTGAAARVSAAQVGALATAISNKTGIDDEQIQVAENLLLTFTKVRNEVGRGNDIFSQASEVLVDMGKALGTDASGSAIQLGKALNDPIQGITALTRVGVTFSEQQKEQIKGFVEGGRLAEAQKIILAELRTEFGGSAAAQATAADRLRVIYGNIREDLGNRLIPVIDRFASLAAVVLPKGLDLAGRAGARLQRVLAPVFRNFAYGAGILRNAFRAGDTFGLTGRDGLEGKFAVVGRALRLVVDGVRRFVADVRNAFAERDTFGGGADRLQQAALVIGQALGRLVDLARVVAQDVSRLVTNVLLPALRRIGPSVLSGLTSAAERLSAFIEFLASPQGEGARKALLGLVAGVVAFKVAEDAAGRVNRLVDRVAKLGELARKNDLVILAKRVNGLASKTVHLAVSGAKEAEEAVRRVADQLAKIKDRAVSVAVKAQVDAREAGKVGLSLAQSIASGLAGAVGGLLAPVIVGALAGVSLVPVLIVVGVAAVGALIFVFRKQIGTFFTETLPRFLLDTVPRAVGRALADSFGSAVVDALNLARLGGRLFRGSAGLGFDIGSGILGGIGDGLAAFTGVFERFVTESIPRFFTETLPAALVNAIPTLSRFFTEQLPSLVFGKGNLLERLGELQEKVEQFLLSLPGRAVDAVKAFPGLVLDALGLRGIAEAVGRALSNLADGFRDRWREINEDTQGRLNDIVGTIAGLPGRLLELVTDVASAAARVGRAVIEGIADGVTKATGFVGDFAKGLANAVIDLINKQIIDRVNSALDFKIPVPFGPDIHIDPPDIPRIKNLAAGAIVPARPGVGLLARLGEGIRDEAVIPLPPGLVAALERIAAGGGDGGTSVVVQEARTPFETGIEIARRLRAEQWVGR